MDEIASELGGLGRSTLNRHLAGRRAENASQTTARAKAGRRLRAWPAGRLTWRPGRGRLESVVI